MAAIDRPMTAADCLDAARREALAAPPSRNELLEKIAKARAHVCQIAAGDERWRMSIPAQPDYDSDLLIVDALDQAEKYIRSESAPRDQYPDTEADGVVFCGKCGAKR